MPNWDLTRGIPPVTTLSIGNKERILPIGHRMAPEREQYFPCTGINSNNYYGSLGKAKKFFVKWVPSDVGKICK